MQGGSHSSSGDLDRQGYCLYKLGCKGPQTHANCSVLSFCEVVDAWPIGIGHPCVGCTEQSLAFRVPIHTTVDIDRPTPPATYPRVHEPQGSVGAGAAGVAGLIGGALLGGGYAVSKRRAPPRRRSRRRARRCSVGIKHDAPRSSACSPAPPVSPVSSARVPRSLSPCRPMPAGSSTRRCASDARPACRRVAARPTTSTPIRFARALPRAQRFERPGEDGDQAVPGRRSAVLLQGAMHALCRPCLHGRLHARRALKT